MAWRTRTASGEGWRRRGCVSISLGTVILQRLPKLKRLDCFQRMRMAGTRRKGEEYISRETLPPNHLKCPVNSFENYAWIIAKPRIRERFSSRVSRLDQTMDRFAFAWRRFIALQTDQNLNEFFNLFEVGLESKKF